MAALDPYSIPVDGAIIRSVLTRRTLKKFPKLSKKPPTNVYKRDDKGKITDSSIIAKNRPIRVSHTKIKPINRELECLLWKPEFIEHSPTIVTAKRKQCIQLREELNEKNPYCLPIEGLTHNLRNVTEPLKRSLRDVDNKLPYNEKIPERYKRMDKAKNIAKRIYDEAAPNAKFDPVGRTRTAFILDNVKAQEYLDTWKEIERKIMWKKFRNKDYRNIDDAIKNEERDLVIKKESLRMEAITLEKAFAYREECLIELQHILVAEKEISRQKIEEHDILMEKYVILRHKLYSSMSRFNELYLYHFFLHALSPVEWQKKQNKVCNISDLVNDTGVYTTCFRKHSVLLDDLQAFDVMLTNSIEKPNLYFDSPEALLQGFTDLEDFIYTLLCHSRVITAQAEDGQRKLTELTLAFAKECNLLVQMKVDLEEEVVWIEERTEELKNFCHSFVFGPFAKLLAKTEEWKFRLQDCYEIALDDVDDIDLSPCMLMRTIEYKIVRFMEEADPSDPVILSVIKQMNRQCRIQEKAEKEFAKTYREYEMLLKSLRRAYEAAYLKGTRKVKERSRPPDEKGDKVEPPPPLTEEEIENFYRNWAKATARQG